MANGITPGSSIFDNFDEIDIAIITDETLEKAISQVEKDTFNGDIYSPSIMESVYVAEMEMDYPILESDENIISDDVDDTSTYDLADQAAAEYIDTYYDMAHGADMDVGSMIDFLVGQK